MINKNNDKLIKIENKNSFAKGIFGENLFYELITKSINFKKFFSKKICQELYIKIDKNCSWNIDWKNKENEQFKPFDFEILIQNSKQKIRFFIDIKYWSNNFKFTQPNNLVQNLIKKYEAEDEQCFFFYVVWIPNFYDFNPKKNNFINIKIVTK